MKINRVIQGAITLVGGNYQLNLPSNSAPKQNALAEYNLEEVFVNCDTNLDIVRLWLPSVATFGGDRSVKIYINCTGTNEVTVNPFVNLDPPIQDTINGTVGGWSLTNGQTGYFQIVSNGNWAFFLTAPPPPPPLVGTFTANTNVLNISVVGTATIDWGDGNFETITNTSVAHNYGYVGIFNGTISSNNLTSLNIYGGLTVLDVSTNVNLQTLYCGVNSLTSLNVFSNVNLQSLYCQGNSLTSLNLFGAVNLQTLFCYSNSLTSLGLSANVNLQTLDCGYNSLTSLNTSSNVNLQYLDCSNNNSLTSLDVSANVNLQYLGCYSNSLTSLNVSSNVNLQSLYCNNNSLTSISTGLAQINYLQTYSNLLPSSEINTLLANLVLANVSNGTFKSLNQTPPAPPTGQGIVDKATLQGLGWTVATD